MTREEAIKLLNEFILFKKISNITEEETVECFKLAVEALQQQPSEDEKVIKVSKGTLKARTGRYVIYDVEWLKTHFNTTEAKIYGQPNEDCISRKAAIDALWKALHEYEDKTENQFSESKELDVADWFQYRIFVQNMSDIDRQTILNLPSVTPQPKEESQQKTGHWVLSGGYWRCSECKEKALLKLDKATGGYREYEPVRSNYCPQCGAKMQEVKK